MRLSVGMRSHGTFCNIGGVVRAIEVLKALYSTYILFFDLSHLSFHMAW